MATTFTSDGIIDILKYPFQDPDWQNKLLIGSVLTLGGFLIIPFFFVYGYYYQIMRHIIVEQGEPHLPAWDDWGKLFRDGAKVFGVHIIFSLPFLLLFCGGYVLMFGVIAGTGAIAETGPDGNGPSGLAGLLPLIGMVGWLGCFGLAMLGGIAMGVVLPAAVGHVVATDDFGAAFRFGEWWAIFRANLAGYLIAYVIIMGLSVALNLALQVLYVTIVLCCLVPFLLVFITLYFLLISGALYGQVYRDGVEQLAQKGQLSGSAERP